MNSILPAGVADNQSGFYYVSCRDGERYSMLLGPFKDDHVKALEWVEAVRKKAYELDAKASWYAFGTLRLLPDQQPKAGLLNDLFPRAFEQERTDDEPK